jgi:hypothetical protein
VDLGDDPDLSGYDGPIECTCGPWAQGGRDSQCPEHAEANLKVAAISAHSRGDSAAERRALDGLALLERQAVCSRCRRLGYTDADSGWCQECLHGPLPT